MSQQRANKIREMVQSTGIIIKNVYEQSQRQYIVTTSGNTGSYSHEQIKMLEIMGIYLMFSEPSPDKQGRIMLLNVEGF